MTEKVIISPRRNHITKNFAYSPSRHHTNGTSLKRSYSSSQEEEVESSATLSRSSTFASDIQSEGSNNSTRWTTAHWKKLEDWYVRKNRDYQKAANSFYYFESLINIELPNDQDNTDGAPITKELWTLDHIMWRSQCLDTSVKFHHGLLPSERKKKDKKRKLNNGSSSSSSTTSSSSTALPGSSTGNSNTDSSTSFKRPVTPAARVASSRPTTPTRVATASSSRTTTPTRVATSSSSRTTTPVRRVPSYTSSLSFDEQA